MTQKTIDAAKMTTIDALKMTRTIRDRNYERLRNASRKDRLAYYRERARQMNDVVANLTRSTRDTSNRA